MKEKNNNILRRDEGLRRATAWREGRIPKMSADLNERLMSRVEKKRRWIWGVAASIAVVVLAVIGMLAPSSSSLSQSSGSKIPNSKPYVHEVASASDTLLASCDVKGKGKNAETDTLLYKAVKAVLKALKPEMQGEREKPVEAVMAKTAEDTVELTSDQMAMANYVAQLAQKYKAKRMPLNCHENEGKGVIYMFPDDEESDVFARLCMAVMWLDTDKPSVRMSYSSSQMTLELAGDKKRKEANEVWLADRRDGRIYLYHSQSAEDEWASAGCYMDFLAVNTPPHFSIDMRKE